MAAKNLWEREEIKEGSGTQPEGNPTLASSKPRLQLLGKEVFKKQGLKIGHR